ncbi:Perphorin-1 [Tetrabaena socialis]|uniref:Perphorin-1 n=1 Tax=Tetrabaena socialis TaxID=47790 RepID=A0A2J8AKB2_9CHLO|nr:Perphorin-1 [Tetrabaena socialis]|eukprot:PNH12957.1 Perphorin-1 [Tetrabaena socialis]
MARPAMLIAALSFILALVTVHAGPQTGIYEEFPFCQCQKAQSAYSLAPTVSALGGSKFCFKLNVKAPAGATGYCATKADLKKIESDCGLTTSALKMEFYADDAQRRRITGVALMPAGSSTFKFLSPTWGAVGEDTVKATPLKWSKEQAAGGKVCLELDDGTTLGSFCKGATDSDSTCWANIFDDTKNCCPLFASAL